MRLDNRQIKNFDEIVTLLDNCDTIRLALFDDSYPYIVPLSFGFEVVNGKVVIYFHGAKLGKKHDLIVKNNKACVEADILNGYKIIEQGITADYKSIIGFGEIYTPTADEEIKGLKLIMQHCKIENYSAKDCAALHITAVYKIILNNITAKKRF